MPPDPVGSRPGTSVVLELPRPAVETDERAPDWYDRSSLPGDFMVMIAGQTAAEYLRRSPDHRFCEFIDGIVYMPPSVKPEHQFSTQFLLCLISCFHACRPLGVVLTGPVVLKLRDDCLLEPDLFVLPVGGRTQIEGSYCLLPALLVVEVLSPSNRSYDLNQKAALYREANIPEIWFVDGRDRVVIVERLEAGAYVTERIVEGPVVSRSLPGFWFDAGWLWAEPEPNLLDCLNQVLAGPPAR